MSRMVWSKLLIPAADVPRTVLKDEVFNEIIEDVRHYPVATSDFPIQDPKSLRSMSRASVMLAHLCESAKDVMAPYLAKSPFSIGVYCAVENGPVDAPSTLKIAQEIDKIGSFAVAYKRLRNPKMYLKQLPNLAPAQMGIFMGLQGPMNVYTHSTHAGFHALEQAEWDLAAGVVDAALVCTAHAFDDFLVIKRMRHYDQRCLSEGAAALFLVSDEAKSRTDWSAQIQDDREIFYGISNPIINLLKEKVK